MAFDPVKGRYLKVDSVTNSCPFENTTFLGVKKASDVETQKGSLVRDFLLILKYDVIFWNSQCRELTFWIKVDGSVGF